MSVYTELNTHEFTQLLSHYDLGSLVSFQGIAAGIENTNYKIRLNKSDVETDYFLTIFEEISQSELDFFIPLLAHLKNNGCHVAGPKPQINGQYVLTTKQKPAAIFDCLSGYHVEDIQTQECFTIGAELARVHLAAKDFSGIHQNLRGYYWLHKQISNHQLNTSADDTALLESALSELQTHWARWQTLSLPKGFIHGDLFPDNSLFNDASNISGIIDFYAGGTDYWVYDLAITIMAWSSEHSNNTSKIDSNMQQALISGYESVRSLNDEEKNELTGFIKLAALRFWVSRLIAEATSSDAALTTSKDPDQMKNLLLSLG
jgi:homoserine kinase type II